VPPPVIPFLQPPICFYAALAINPWLRLEH
jgi:hypothetical protein